jgi:acylpyruvate hydrolase
MYPEFRYCLAVDMTARDLQTAAKAKGWPWSVAKGYDTFLPHGDVIPASDVSE